MRIETHLTNIFTMCRVCLCLVLSVHVQMSKGSKYNTVSTYNKLSRDQNGRMYVFLAKVDKIHFYHALRSIVMILYIEGELRYESFLCHMKLSILY